MPVKVTGAAEVSASLEGLPAEIVARGFKKALEAGGGVLLEGVQARTPSDPDATSAKDGGDLKSAITIDVDLYPNGGIAKVGFGEKSWIANFVEWGHWQKGHGAEIGHKGELRDAILGHVSPHPFMRPAAATVADAAVEAFENVLMEVLNS